MAGEGVRGSEEAGSADQSPVAVLLLDGDETLYRLWGCVVSAEHATEPLFNLRHRVTPLIQGKPSGKPFYSSSTDIAACYTEQLNTNTDYPVMAKASVIKACLEILSSNGVPCLPGSQRIGMEGEDSHYLELLMAFLDVVLGENRQSLTREQAIQLFSRIKEIPLTKKEKEAILANLRESDPSADESKITVADRINFSKNLLLLAAHDVFGSELPLDHIVLVDDKKKIVESAREDGYRAIQATDCEAPALEPLIDAMISYIPADKLLRSLEKYPAALQTELLTAVVRRAGHHDFSEKTQHNRKLFLTLLDNIPNLTITQELKNKISNINDPIPVQALLAVLNKLPPEQKNQLFTDLKVIIDDKVDDEKEHRKNWFLCLLNSISDHAITQELKDKIKAVKTAEETLINEKNALVNAQVDLIETTEVSGSGQTEKKHCVDFHNIQLSRQVRDFNVATAALSQCIANDIEAYRLYRQIHEKLKAYQVHLLREIDIQQKKERISLFYDYGELSEALPKKINCHNTSQKSSKKMEPLLQKYEKVQALRDAINDPKKTAFARLSAFSELFNQPNTQKILSAHRDSLGRRLIKYIGYILATLLTAFVFPWVKPPYTKSLGGQLWTSVKSTLSKTLPVMPSQESVPSGKQSGGPSR